MSSNATQSRARRGSSSAKGSSEHAHAVVRTAASTARPALGLTPAEADLAGLWLEPAPRQSGRPLVRDVLADVRMPVSAQPHDLRPPGEGLRDRRLEALELVGLDPERERAEP